MPSCTSLKEQRQAVRIKCARLLQPAKQPQSRKNGCVVKGWELHSLRIRSRKLQHVCRFTLLRVKLLHGQIIGAQKHSAGRKSQMRANSQQTALPSCLIICISSGKAAENWQTTLSSLITGGGCKHSRRHCVSREEWFSTKGPFPSRKGFLQCALRGVALECQRFACAHRDDSSGNRMYPLALKLATRTKSWFRDLTLHWKTWRDWNSPIQEVTTSSWGTTATQASWDTGISKPPMTTFAEYKAHPSHSAGLQNPKDL